jgi:hypothetical protein
VAVLLVFAQAVIAIADLGLVGDSQWNLSRSLALAERVARLRERAGGALLPRERAPRAAAEGRVALRLEEVRFIYPGRDTPTLDGLSLEVPAGQSLAIVGENGAGKSTLIKLVCGLYEPQGGRVTLDGAAPLEARGRVGSSSRTSSATRWRCGRTWARDCALIRAHKEDHEWGARRRYRDGHVGVIPRRTAPGTLARSASTNPSGRKAHAVVGLSWASAGQRTRVTRATKGAGPSASKVRDTPLPASPSSAKR